LFSGLPVPNPNNAGWASNNKDKISVGAQDKSTRDRERVYRTAVGCERMDTSRGKRPDVDGRRAENRVLLSAINPRKGSPESLPRENEEILGVVGTGEFETVVRKLQVPNPFRNTTRFGREPQ
jgi:hypothetical protein